MIDGIRTHIFAVAALGGPAESERFLSCDIRKAERLKLCRDQLAHMFALPERTIDILWDDLNPDLFEGGQSPVYHIAKALERLPNLQVRVAFHQNALGALEPLEHNSPELFQLKERYPHNVHFKWVNDRPGINLVIVDGKNLAYQDLLAAKGRDGFVHVLHYAPVLAGLAEQAYEEFLDEHGRALLNHGNAGRADHDYKLALGLE